MSRWPGAPVTWSPLRALHPSPPSPPGPSGPRAPHHPLLQVHLLCKQPLDLPVGPALPRVPGGLPQPRGGHRPRPHGEGRTPRAEAALLGRGHGAPDQLSSLQEDNCPQFLNPSPLVIPMNHETDVTFQGKNLDTVKVAGLVGYWPGSPAGAVGVGGESVGLLQSIFLQNQSSGVWCTFELSWAWDPAHKGGAPRVSGHRRQQRHQNGVAFKWTSRT